VAKFHWRRILDNPSATQLLWAELGHEDPTLLDEVCSTSGPLAKNTLISFNYEDGQGNPARCGIEKIAGMYVFFGEYCAYEDDAGPFNDFEDAFGCIMDKNTIDVSLVDYDVTSALPLDQTLAICARHVAEGKIIIINDRQYTLKEGKLVELPSK
jgi:hypothetical protein